MKKCFKCNTEKPLSEYYKHPQMGDGHLNKCKDCARKDSDKNYKHKIKDPAFAELERYRGREKYYRLYKGRIVENKSAKPYRDKYPEKYNALIKSQRIKLNGYESHHWSYKIENATDVIFLRTKDHHKLHRY